MNRNVVNHEIRVERTAAGLGLSIAGGIGSTPYKGTDEGIFISRITEDGPADLAGLKEGDKVLEVNGISVVDADHYQAVEILKASGSELVLLVSREEPISNSVDNNVSTPRLANDSLQAAHSTPKPAQEATHKITLHTTLIRDHIGQGLGFSIAGGKGSAPFKEGLDGIYISGITEAGLAHRDGKVLVGDKVQTVCNPLGSTFATKYNEFAFSLLQINGIDITNDTHEAAVHLLTDHQRFVRLVVQREVTGPLEPPSPYTPSYWRGSNGFMATRSAYKRPSFSNSISSSNGDLRKSITSQFIKSTMQSPNTPTSGKNVSLQPIPAPRRFSPQNSNGVETNGQAKPISSNGNHSEHGDIQVTNYNIREFCKEFCINFYNTRCLYSI